jgi:pilus assembly protein CpaE
VAVNLAVALQRLHEEQNKQVALVDASLQFGDVGVMLNLKASRSIADVAPHIDELDEDLFESVFMAHTSGLKCLLAPPRPEMADLVQPQHIPTILSELRHYFDYIVVDTWSFLGDLVLNVLDNADRVVLLATPDIPSLASTKLFFEVTEALEYPHDKILLVLNKMDRSTRISAKDISESLKHQVAGQIALDERAVSYAINRGAPITWSDRKSPAAQNISDLARYIVESLEAVEEEMVDNGRGTDARGRRVGRLFG